jgi:hypothetical protein
MALFMADISRASAAGEASGLGETVGGMIVYRLVDCNHNPITGEQTAFVTSNACTWLVMPSGTIQVATERASTSAR